MTFVSVSRVGFPGILPHFPYSSPLGDQVGLGIRAAHRDAIRSPDRPAQGRLPGRAPEKPSFATGSVARFSSRVNRFIMIAPPLMIDAMLGIRLRGVSNALETCSARVPLTTECQVQGKVLTRCVGY